MSDARIAFVDWLSLISLKGLFLARATMYLAEVVPIERKGGLRPQLEQMKLSGDDLLRGGHSGQIELVLHLFTSH